MKLRILEYYKKYGDLGYRLFEDGRYSSQGYYVFNNRNKLINKRYYVNHIKIGFELWENKKNYHI